MEHGELKFSIFYESLKHFCRRVEKDIVFREGVDIKAKNGRGDVSQRVFVHAGKERDVEGGWGRGW